MLVVRMGDVLEQSCDSDINTDEESNKLLEEQQPAPTTRQRIKLFLRKNWRNILVLVCLWIAFSLSTAAFSLIAPFFPKEVDYRYYASPAPACFKIARHFFFFMGVRSRVAWSMQIRWGELSLFINYFSSPVLARPLAIR